MKPLISILFALSALLSPALWAQVPATPAKPATPVPKLTAKDIKVFRFAMEFKEQTFPMNDRDMPDELRVTTTERIHITGKKRGDSAARVKERMISNIGKVALMPPGDRTGKLTVKFPSAEEVRSYFATVQRVDDALETEEIHLVAGKTYKWSVKTISNDTVFTVTDGDTDVTAITTPTNKLKRLGFAATVLNQNNEADLVVTFD
jgi:ribosomal protein L11